MRIEELEKLLKAPSPGPWSLLFTNTSILDANGFPVASDLDDPDDAKAIVALWNNAEKLLAVVKAAKELCSEYETETVREIDWNILKRSLEDLEKE